MDSNKTCGEWLQSNCGAVIAFYRPSASVLMCRCVISWKLTLVPLADAPGKFIAHQSIRWIFICLFI